MDGENSFVLTQNSYEKASWISKLYFNWARKQLWLSYKGVDVTKQDVPHELSTSKLGNELKRKWENQIKNGLESKFLLKILCQMFLRQSLLASLLLFTKMCFLNLIQVNLVRILLSSYSQQENEALLFKRYIVSGLQIFFILIAPYFHVNSHRMCEEIGAKMRIAASAIVFDKLLRIKTAEIKRMNIGQLINIFASDVGKFEENAKNLCGKMFDALAVVSYVIFLYLTVGLSGLIGFIVVFVSGLFFLYFGKIFKKIGKEKVQLVDMRLKLTREMISEIRAMKLLCWEEIYSKSITEIRNKELRLCFYNYCCKTLYSTLSSVFSTIGMFIVLNLMLTMKVPISSEVVYPCLTVLNFVELVVVKKLSSTLENGAYAWVSIKRIEKILRLPETDNAETETNNFSPIMKNIFSGWMMFNPDDKDKFLLKKVNLEFNKSAVTIVTGPVGSGKSTLLLTMANELYIYCGELKISNSITYLPQEPWLFPATIKQNILFGLPYDEQRYHRVLSSCALLQDLSIFPKADLTYVDDKGLTLSGGQKARIALTRALYRQSDVYLFDDPLSAVDVKVGRHIWQKCFQNTDKTIILVSHTLQFLKDNDTVVYMDKGCARMGNYQQMKNQLNYITPADLVDKTIEEKIYKNLFCISSEKKIKQLDEKLNEDNLKNNTKYKEFRANSLLLYCKLAYKIFNGWGVLLLIIALSLLTQISTIIYSICFISFVYHKGNTDYNSSNVLQADVSVATLGYLLLIEILLFSLQNITFFYMCIRASKKIHQQVLHSVMRTDMKFFDTHTTGQILSRFSKDIELVDVLLPTLIFDSVRSLSQLLGYITNAAYSNPIVLAPIAACLASVSVIIKMYDKAVASIKIKEASARSPIYSYMNCTVNGGAVIRTHQNQAKVTEEFNARQDYHAAVWFLLKGIGYWMSTVCEIIGYVVTISVIVLALILPNFTNNSRLGMGISSTYIFGALLQVTILTLIDANHLITSVPRLYNYIGLEPEEGYHLDESTFPPSWPTKGTITFKNVTLSYDATKTEALKSINFEIQPGEKIGIVGRTGAGKSSLLTALFRLTSIKGRIEIDGLDIKTIPLAQYRKMLSIIPQNPVILSGSVRRNLDPQSKFGDEDLWSVLESVQLKEEVMKMENGLENGIDQFSVGQKQLFCLARTLLHQNRIVILDEATSNVDSKTDKIIQQLIRTKFSSATILVIAHRLQTVLDLDKIMVMHNGRIMEFDQPSALLSKPDGLLKSMVDKSNIII